MFTNIAVNKGNSIGNSDAICIPMFSDIVVKELKLKCFLHKSFTPIKRVIKARHCWTEVKHVCIRIVKDRIFLSGLAIQYKTFIGEDNISFCQHKTDEFSIAASAEGLEPGMAAKWRVMNKEYSKVHCSHSVMYWNELTFDVQIIEQKTLWVKTRLFQNELMTPNKGLIVNTST
jgi:hypothetical protein